eukprot:TRINITY_DN1964_c0_g2_i2.p1 TRINITY_DN1964_c0_g2~~TRINITY_DN1964_c0_g2_i2.p1  ORF type:complete len:400 (+),score=121.98 TRINITY_DN1964_c0_g2_i2:969-2168(+)
MTAKEFGRSVKALRALLDEPSKVKLLEEKEKANKEISEFLLQSLQANVLRSGIESLGSLLEGGAIPHSDVAATLKKRKEDKLRFKTQTKIETDNMYSFLLTNSLEELSQAEEQAKAIKQEAARQREEDEAVRKQKREQARQKELQKETQPELEVPNEEGPVESEKSERNTKKAVKKTVKKRDDDGFVMEQVIIVQPDGAVEEVVAVPVVAESQVVSKTNTRVSAPTENPFSAVLKASSYASPTEVSYQHIERKVKGRQKNSDVDKNQLENQTNNQAQSQPKNQDQAQSDQNQPKKQNQNQPKNQNQNQPKNQAQSKPQNQSQLDNQSQPKKQIQNQPKNLQKNQNQNQKQNKSVQKQGNQKQIAGGSNYKLILLFLVLAVAASLLFRDDLINQIKKHLE